MMFPLLGNWHGRPVKIWGQRKVPSGLIYRCKQLFPPYGYINIPASEVAVTVPDDRPALPAWEGDVDEFLIGAAKPINEKARVCGPSHVLVTTHTPPREA